MNAKVQSWFYIMTKLVSPPAPAVTNHQRKWIKSKAKWTWSEDEDVQFEMPESCSAVTWWVWQHRPGPHTQRSGGLGWAQGSALLSGSRATLTLLAGALGTAVLAELTGEWWHHAHITEAKEQKILTPEILTFTESTYLRASLVAQQ